MHLLILGGSSDHPGGVEAFCERSAEALGRSGEWRINRIPTGTAFLTLRRLPVLLGGLASLFRYRRQRPDVVWLQYVNLPDLCYLAFAKLLGLRVMVTPHLGSNWRSQSNPALRALSGWLLGFADRLALISPTQEREINLPAALPRSLIRNFLPAAVLGSVLPDEGSAPPVLQLIHSGRLSEGKGTFLFVEVCEQLRASGVPFFARITGGADETTSARLHAMIAERDLGDQVAVLGRVPEAVLLDLLQRSDILIHLSRIDSYPLIVLEAMACSMLPVCMELAGARDMVETYDGQVVSTSGAVEEAASFLARQDLADLRRRGRIAAAKVRADYNWDRCAGALAAALRACVAEDRTLVTRPDPVI
ncbi:glycosyltransferase family 4 protein [Roseomonas sp. BN140053]|uniref:glycosyltransferase family 4 protein n=1 Tax=Roseomonas sp. BN140053 TaxID=3391898 RepID=UPI0039E8F4DC